MFKTLIVIFVSLLSAICATNQQLEVLKIWENYSKVLTFNTTNLRDECRFAYQNLIEKANTGNLDALKILDASGKVPSGILNGNVQQYGDFDQCLSIKEAQYCLIEFDLEPIWTNHSVYKNLRNLVHSYYMFRDSFYDPPHRIPGFSTIRWGFCLPKQCTKDDLIQNFEENLGVVAYIRDGMCQKAVVDPEPTTLGHQITKAFFGLLLTLIGLSSVTQFLLGKEQFKSSLIGLSLSRSNSKLVKIFMGFSLQENLRKMFEIKENDPNEIVGFHCARSICAFALLMCHKSLVLFFNPYMNRTYTIERLSSPWTVIAKHAIVYTDVFLLISGALNAYSLLNDLEKKQTMNLWNKFINRLFRILPNLIAVILFCTYILPNLNRGPLWPVVIQTHSELCQKYMWRNLLFIHNYYGFENMCLTHTHQLGIDMQLFLITPIFMYIFTKSKKYSGYLLILIILSSSLLRFWVTYTNELTSVVYFGISISKMFETANLTYIMPTHRATIYFIGVALAILLKFTNRHPNWTGLQVTGLWCLILTPFLFGWLSPYSLCLKEYQYNRLNASILATFIPLCFGFGTALGLYVFNRNCGGFLRDLFNWKYWQYGTKISYALYLIQFPVYFYNVGITKHIDEYLPSFQLGIVETTTIVLLSIILTVTVEMPFINMSKVLFNQRRIQQISKVGDKRIERKLKFG